MKHGEIINCTLSHRNCLEAWCPDCGYNIHVYHDGTRDGLWAAQIKLKRLWAEDCPTCLPTSPAMKSQIDTRRAEDIAWHRAQDIS